MALVGLTVTVLQGRDLADTDAVGKSDPFLKLIVGTQQSSTTVKENTLNPSWNETFHFDASTNPPVLHLEMWDKDPVGKDSMGEGVLPLDGDLKRDLMAAGEHRSVTKIVPLHRKGKLAGSVELEVIGEFRGSAEYGAHHRASVDTNATLEADDKKLPSPTKGEVLQKLYITAVNGTDLINVEPLRAGKSDPLCQLTVGRITMETRPKRNTLNPTWAEKFAFRPTSNEVIVSVMDEGERKRDPMGTGVLEITEQMKRDMKKGPRQHTVALMQGNRPAGNVRLLLEGEYGSSGPMDSSIRTDSWDQTVSMIKPADRARKNSTTRRASGSKPGGSVMRSTLRKKSGDSTMTSITRPKSSDTVTSTTSSKGKGKKMTAMERLDAADGKMDGKYFGDSIGDVASTHTTGAHSSTPHANVHHDGRHPDSPTKSDPGRTYLTTGDPHGTWLCCLEDSEFPGKKCQLKFNTEERLLAHQGVCGFALERCPNPQCSVRTSKQSMDIHLQKCPWQTLSCARCKAKYYRMDQDYHHSMCPLMEVYCPLGCGKLLLRADVQAHIEKDYMRHPHEMLAANDFLPPDHPHMVYASLLKSLKALRVELELARNPSMEGRAPKEVPPIYSSSQEYAGVRSPQQYTSYPGCIPCPPGKGSVGSTSLTLSTLPTSQQVRPSYGSAPSYDPYPKTEQSSGGGWDLSPGGAYNYHSSSFGTTSAHAINGAEAPATSERGYLRGQSWVQSNGNSGYFQAKKPFKERYEDTMNLMNTVTSACHSAMNTFQGPMSGMSQADKDVEAKTAVKELDTDRDEALKHAADLQQQMDGILYSHETDSPYREVEVEAYTSMTLEQLRAYSHDMDTATKAMENACYDLKCMVYDSKY
jgi:hypothetical protein|mmetsp:Transcript_5133/g.9171  ORF Transcript_5133/g.9171 Transcript_5133/m.9171 type:complete len:868 (-) Transcript_5133:1568-4171(-)